MIEYAVHEPVGATVAGLRPAQLGEDDVAQLRRLLADHGVLILREQHLDDAGFVAFLRRLGPSAFTTGETAVPGFPELNVVSNVGRTTPPRSTFHVDTSYVARPPAYTALRAVQLPAQGGETLFTDQYRAAAALPPEVRGRVEGRTIRHVVTGLELGDEDETAAEHPILRPHPLTGRVALYLTTPARCAAVSGLPDDEAQDLIAFLFEHSTREDNVFRHAWSPGDVVMWDNACVLHRADHSGVVGDRVMHRGMVAASG
jgi:taurine dioxygenase